MNRSLRLAIVSFAAFQFVMLSATTRAEESPIKRYFGGMTEREAFNEWEVYKNSSPDLQAAFKSIGRRATINGRDEAVDDEASLYLFVGDIFHFIGEKTRTSPSEPVSAPYNIDAVILSTNIDLAWGMSKDSKGNTIEYENPTIQWRLWKHLTASKSPSALNANTQISATFEKHGPVDVLTEPVVVGPLEEFSPRLFCFLAADRKEGGTYDDPKFLEEELTMENLSDGVYKALVLLDTAGAKSVVLPFIGSSNPELRKDLDGYQKRAKKIERMDLSLQGTLEGISKFMRTNNAKKRSISEIGIVIWHADVKRVSLQELKTTRQIQNNMNFGIPAMETTLLKSFDAKVKKFKAPMNP